MALHPSFYKLMILAFCEIVVNARENLWDLKWGIHSRPWANCQKGVTLDERDLVWDRDETGHFVRVSWDDEDVVFARGGDALEALEQAFLDAKERAEQVRACLDQTDERLAPKSAA